LAAAPLRAGGKIAGERLANPLACGRNQRARRRGANLLLSFSRFCR
jgi:hypothetical protein